MTDQYINAIIERIPDAKVQAQLEGNHLHVTVVSGSFAGQSPVKKQQAVYAALNPYIADGTIHAVHMQTLTPEEQS